MAGITHYIKATTFIVYKITMKTENTKPSANATSKAIVTEVVLTAEEAADKTANESPPKSVSIWALYKYAEKRDKILLFFGLLTGIAAGACMPIMCVLVGCAIDSFSMKYTTEEVLTNASEKALWIVYNSLVMFFFSMIAEGCWIAIGERLGIRVRILCLEAIMNKSVTWFDISKPQELPSKIGSLVMRYQGGIGEKVGKVLMSGSMFVAGVIVAFLYGWKFALSLLAIYPLTVLAAKRMGTARTSKAGSLRRAYSRCAGYAEEALSAVRTVYAFCAEQFEKSKYVKELFIAQQAAISNARSFGAAIGLLNFSVILTEGLGFFIGSYFIQYDVYNSESGRNYSCASVITVFFAGMFAMISLGLISPALGGVEEAKQAAYDIYEIISSEQTEEVVVEGRYRIPPEMFTGRIEFKNVTFSYPAKPDVKVLKNFSMVFEPGYMTGICGETGSGKSTIIQLIERFYKPTDGVIEVDGVNINTLELKWWRETIGFVGQEPVLFNTSIKNNIAYGKEGADIEEITEAARSANAMEFIERLDNKFDTETGTGGGQLSGGQKQRIAIARALVRKPKIILLDEATSALDTTSERKVQEAFWSIQKEGKIAAIVVAHRLSTIKSANKILVLNQGTIAEQGTDAELRALGGIYANLCKLQDIASDNNAKSGDDSVDSIKLEIVSTELNNHAQSSANHQENVKDAIDYQNISSGAEVAVPETQKSHKSQIWAENWKHKYHLIFAIILSILAGYNQPISGSLLGMVTFDLLQIDKATLRTKVNEDFIGYIVSGVGIFFVQLGMYWLFGIVNAKVSANLRERLYGHILSMDVGWFDKPQNQPYALNYMLATETENINGVVERVACTFIQATSAFFISLGIAFYFSYKMTAIIIGSVPVLIFSEAMHTRFHIGFAKQNEALYKKPMEIISEAVKNFRTVASFSNEQRIVHMYRDALGGPLKSLQLKAMVSGFLYGVCQMIPMLIYAEVFYLAAWFLVRYHEDPRDTFVAAYSLCFTALELGTLQQYGPDVGKAWSALSTVYGILDQKTSITAPDQAPRQEVTGKIEFENVQFKYPTRGESVLQGLSMTVEPGQKITIVGSSGSGKSTIIQLLERFYDVSGGKILIDGVNIKEYPLSKLREIIGYVPQEPYLFDETIEENVKYSKQDATEPEIREACKIADAISFIERDLPEAKKAENSSNNINEQQSKEAGLVQEQSIQISMYGDIGKGFKRKVGVKGSLLSGGQKQRLAIARAILKKPKIMLFDEATSALDSETESEVQKALNRVSDGRTSITVAHRLSAVGDEGIIFVLDNGKIVESGQKKELIEKKGYFYKLYGNSVAV